MIEKIRYEIPSLEKESLDVRKRKQVTSRNGYGIRLRSLSENRRVARLFGTRNSLHLASLSQYDARKGALSDDQRDDVRAISSIINGWAREHMRTKIDLVVPEELEKVLITGDPSSFAFSIARRLAIWKEAQPLYRHKLGERCLRARAELESALSDQELAEAAEKEGTSIGAVIGFIVGIFEAVDEGIDIVNDIIDSFCGPDLEEHSDPFEEISIWRQSYLNVPWRGYEWGDNNQEFTAQYIVDVKGGSVDELEVRFRIDLSGSGFDRLDYPIEAYVSTQDGYSYPTPTPIRTTRYQQIHKVVAHNVGFMQIAVVGRVHYGRDGFMTDAGLVPSGTATKNGVSLDFGAGDSIWKYGISV